MALPTFTAGRKVRASELNAIVSGLRPLHAHKTADQTLNNGTGVGGTLQNDTHLFVTMAANTTYRMFLDLLYKEAVSQVIDIKVALTFPALCVLDLGGRGPHTAWNAAPASLEIEWACLQNAAASPSATIAWGSNTTAFGGQLNGMVRNGANAGVLRVQWAQNSPNASNLTVLSGSSMDLFPTA